MNLRIMRATQRIARLGRGRDEDETTTRTFRTGKGHHSPSILAQPLKHG